MSPLEIDFKEIRYYREPNLVPQADYQQEPIHNRRTVVD